MKTDHSNLRLGKRPRRHDMRTLKLARYLTSALPPAPSRVDYTQGITNWGVMLNDTLGCCTIAAVGHAVQTWTANASQEVTVPDSAILNYYEQWDGYNSADPATDQGGVELDVLNDWRQGTFNGHSLDAYVAVELGAGGWGLGAGENPRAQQPASRIHVPVPSPQHPGPDFQHQVPSAQRPEEAIQDSKFKIQEAGTEAPSAQSPAPSTPAPAPSTQSPEPSIPAPMPVPDIATAIWLFGGAYIGVELPLTAQNQDVWDVPKNPGPDDEPGSWGGHAIYLVGYDLGNSGLGVGDSGLGKDDSELRITNYESEIRNLQHPAPSIEGKAGRNQHPATAIQNSTFKIQEAGTSSPSTQHPARAIQDSKFKIQDSESSAPNPVSRVPYPGTLTCVTWGQLKKMTWAWFEKYCSEAYALVSKDWIEASGVAPCGFDLATLESDLKLVTG